ncbi:hypothetical protein BBJ28_00022385 [Nothophytophthora sp. Chile5]|nr:hypothetical protein BBJ28_00022385 [Nothophytophthora sp. Chile5]
MLSLASGTRSLPTRMPEATFNRRDLLFDSLSDGFGALHVYVGFFMSVVGAGMLSVPYTLVLVPKWQALAGILFVGVAMACTANALLHAYVHVAARAEFETRALGAGSKFVGFQALARRASGPALGYAVSMVTASGVYGGCVGNIQILRDLTPFMLSLVYDGATNLSESTQECIHQAILWGLLAVILFPLCMLRNLSALQTTNYLSFALSIYLIGAVVFRALEGHDLAAANISTSTASVNNGSLASVSMASNDLNSYSSSGSLDEPSLAAGEALNATMAATATASVQGSDLERLAQAISIYNFAFMMTLNLLPLFLQLLSVESSGDNSERRRGDSVRGSTVLATASPLLTARPHMTRCIFVVSLICIVLYGALGCAADDLYGNAIDGNILLNLQSDPAMKIPLVATYLTVLFTFPLLFLPLRAIAEELLSQINHSEQPSPAVNCSGFEYGENSNSSQPTSRRFDRLIVVLVLLCSQQLIALNAPGIEIVFSLMGATSCLVICYVFPVATFATVYPWRRAPHGYLWMAVLWTIVAIVTIQGVVCTWLLV